MDNLTVRVGVDIGGTHITAALFRAGDGCYVEGSRVRGHVDPAAGAAAILDAWSAVIDQVLVKVSASQEDGVKAGASQEDGVEVSASREDEVKYDERCGRSGGDVRVEGIGLAMPGPFDYETGTSMIRGLAKYESLFGINIREALQDRILLKNVPILFGNDAACFGLGAVKSGITAGHDRGIAVTLGTGFGACYLENGRLVVEGEGVPANGYVYKIPFLAGTAEDYISTRGLVSHFKVLTGQEADVRAIAGLARMGEGEKGDASEKGDAARTVFRLFGLHLGKFLGVRLKEYRAACLIVGGSIVLAKDLFEEAMRSGLKEEGVDCTITFLTDTERVAMMGAAALVEHRGKGPADPPARKTSQPMLPKRMDLNENGYRLFPAEPLGAGHIHNGYGSLAKWIIERGCVRIDGYVGVDWDLLRHRLSGELRAAGMKVLWYDTSAWLRSEEEVDRLVAPFLGTPGSVWGTRTTLSLEDFFEEGLLNWQPTGEAQVIVLAGVGAGMRRGGDAGGDPLPVIYIDLPKNELQYRMRAGSALNLGSHTANAFAEMYKRSYFVDWVILNRHRQDIKDTIAVVADGQWATDINWALTPSIGSGLKTMAQQVIRARPWFEPGVWGGQWMKRQIPGLSRTEVNYAWSFELIAPENGLILESDGHLLEISFDWLMEAEGEQVLGVDHARYGNAFPIRFDFLDTVDGGNLSIQCHPSTEYIREQFGETITQDETYYILDREGDAGVYLGFQEDIDPAAFREILQRSQQEKTEIGIERYVQKLPAAKHDLFLIPNRTVHGAGIGNLVLEISATPYIFTFKMYDWMRLDLDGQPRPINIEHAFRNLDFERKGQRVMEELVSRPEILFEKGGVKVELLPTHAEHFYAIHRMSLAPGFGEDDSEKRRGLTGENDPKKVRSLEATPGPTTLQISTEGKCHLLMLVEGDTVLLRTGEGREIEMHYAETFVIPAAAKTYELINNSDRTLKLVKAFVKEDIT